MRHINKEFVKMVRAVAETQDATVMSYSGRGMYGKECLAVSLDDSNGYGFTSRVVFEATWEYRGDDDEDSLMEGMLDIIEGTATDNLGRGIVLYWPSVTYEEEREEEEEKG